MVAAAAVVRLAGQAEAKAGRAGAPAVAVREVGGAVAQAAERVVAATEVAATEAAATEAEARAAARAAARAVVVREVVATAAVVPAGAVRGAVGWVVETVAAATAAAGKAAVVTVAVDTGVAAAMVVGVREAARATAMSWHSRARQLVMLSGARFVAGQYPPLSVCICGCCNLGVIRTTKAAMYPHRSTMKSDQRTRVCF